MTRLLAALLTAALLAGCSPTDTIPTGDVVGDRACRDWRDLIADVNTLDGTEQRDRLKALDDTAQDAETDAIRDAARTLLETHTAGDVPAFGDAADAMTAACQELDR